MNKKKLYSNIFFEDISSYKSTNLKAEKIWTSSPGVVEYLLKHKTCATEVDLIDSYTSEKDLNNFNLNLVKGRKELSVILNNFDDKFCNIFRTEIYSLFLILGYKSLILSNWLENISGKTAIVGNNTLKDVEGVDTSFGRYDHLFYNILDKKDIKLFFDIDLINAPKIDNTLFDNFFNKVPAFDSIFNIVNRPLSAILFKLWMKAGFFKLGFNKRGNLKFLELNEGIEETFIPLLKSGWKLGKISFPNVNNTNINIKKYKLVVDEIIELWINLTAKFINKNIQAKTAKLLKDRLLKCLSSYEEHKYKYEAIIKNIPSDTIILSNGLYSTKLRIASAILREKKYKVFTTDHGSSAGLNEWFNYISEDLFNYSNIHFTYNKPIGLDTGLDRNYHEFRKKLIKALNIFTGKVIIKPYPALRFIDDIYATKYLSMKNYIINQGEFRQLRWAGDIIIIDNASSTILWAISTDIPLILINSINRCNFFI